LILDVALPVHHWYLFLEGALPEPLVYEQIKGDVNEVGHHSRAASTRP